MRSGCENREKLKTPNRPCTAYMADWCSSAALLKLGKEHISASCFIYGVLALFKFSRMFRLGHQTGQSGTGGYPAFSGWGARGRARKAVIRRQSGGRVRGLVPRTYRPGAPGALGGSAPSKGELAVKRPPDTAIPLKADMEPDTDCPAYR